MIETVAQHHGQHIKHNLTKCPTKSFLV
jgi:hypothetical protein